MIARVSIASVGRNRNARLNTSATSCVCKPNLRNGENSESTGIGDGRGRGGGKEYGTQHDNHGETADMQCRYGSPSSVMGTEPMVASTVPVRTKNTFANPISANNTRNTRIERHSRRTPIRDAASTHGDRAGANGR